jgi:glycosyltransferase involved in cell wall biosynthesis
MKVILVPFCFAPDPVGGTEVYVAELARGLKELGVHSVIAAPSETSRCYTLDHQKVRRYAIDEVTDVAALYGEGDELGAKEFAKVLDQERPDIVHLHAFTAGVSLRMVREAKSRGIPVVFTYHTPTVSCQRGTLMLWGKEVCDGELRVVRCSSCALNGLGMPRPIAALVARVPRALASRVGDLALQGRAWTVLRASELVAKRHAAFRMMATEVDHIVAVCEWVRNLLRLNGVPADKMSLSRQGIKWTQPPVVHREPSARTSIAFLGRLDPTKGVHVLIEALKSLPQVNITLDIFGVSQSSANSAYLSKLRSDAIKDPRIAFHDPLPQDQVVPRLQHYDFLAVPSQWMETGPLVALEAFAAGIPVIGWDLGGLGELVRHGKNGLLIDPKAASGWAETLGLVSKDARLRAQLKAGVAPPKTSSEVAGEMLVIYQSLSGHRS